MKLKKLNMFLCEHRIKKQDLALKAGMHPSRLSQIMHGICKISTDEKTRIADALGKEKKEIF